MQRTQIYLTQNLVDKIEKEAGIRKVSRSEVIRRILEVSLSKSIKPQSGDIRQDFWDNMEDALKKIKKMNIKAPSDLALNHDKYLYGEDFR